MQNHRDGTMNLPACAGMGVRSEVRFGASACVQKCVDENWDRLWNHCPLGNNIFGFIDWAKCVFASDEEYDRCAATCLNPSFDLY